MSLVNTEQVLVVPTQRFRDCGYFQGFTADVDAYLSELLDPSHTQYLPRGEMETNPEFKQLIPYCIFRWRDDAGDVHVFQYTRGKGMGESRLHSKRSIGIGGHISTLDSAEQSPYESGMQRELDEEVKIDCKFSQTCVGLINDDHSEVGKVHLGVVHVFDVVSPDVVALETDICDSGFVPLATIMNETEQFEAWSQICLDAEIL